MSAETSGTPNPFRDLEAGSQPPPEAPARVEQAQNPYASPQAVEQPEAEVGIWRQGDLLVLHEQAVFPRRCIRDNRPAEQLVHVELTWSCLIDRSAKFDLPICPECWRRRLKVQKAGLIGFVAGLVVCGAASLSPRGWSHELLILSTFAGCVLVFVGLFFFRLSFPLVIKKGRPPYFWIRGASQEFLNELAEPPFR